MSEVVKGHLLRCNTPGFYRCIFRGIASLDTLAIRPFRFERTPMVRTIGTTFCHVKLVKKWLVRKKYHTFEQVVGQRLALPI
jgi:hypothetical protein